MRLLVHVEGQTEEAFVNSVLSKWLYRNGYNCVSARLMGNARLRLKRGGVKSWQSVKAEILRHLREDRNAISTLMVDYYAMPDGENGWPGRNSSPMKRHEHKASSIEELLHQDIVEEMGDGFNPLRFVPYVTMHEFEAFLFSDCDVLAHAIGNAESAEMLHEIRAQFESPEHINDSPITAPSKRIHSIAPNYNKVFHGVLASDRIGIDKIREQCVGFNGWISRLEQIPRNWR